jgi:predicted DNA-binding transcriptional regulator AlpA
MKIYSTRAAAKKLGLPPPTLFHYMRVGKIPKPKSFTSGDTSVHVWSEEDIEHVRKLLPKIANGRKTRYQKIREKQKAQPGAAVPHKSRKPKKKQPRKP